MAFKLGIPNHFLHFEPVNTKLVSCLMHCHKLQLLWFKAAFEGWETQLLLLCMRYRIKLYSKGFMALSLLQLFVLVAKPDTKRCSVWTGQKMFMNLIEVYKYLVMMYVSKSDLLAELWFRLVYKKSYCIENWNGIWGCMIQVLVACRWLLY